MTTLSDVKYLGASQYQGGDSGFGAHHLRPARGALALVFSLLIIPAAEAEEVQALLKYGEGNSHYRKIGLGLRFSPWWNYRDDNWTVRLIPEAEVSHLRYTGSGPGPDSLNMIGGMGILRLQYGQGNIQPFAEFGFGVSLLSKEKLGERQYSTHFQFSEQVALGVEVNQQWWVSGEYAHHSNARIELPNDGMDFYQLAVGFRF